MAKLVNLDTNIINGIKTIDEFSLKNVMVDTSRSSELSAKSSKLVRGDVTKGIKSVGELSLRISRFDSYRLFTLYENANERKVMNISGNQKYYLVFKSPLKEIRIPEYDPKGEFEVDKANGCILFKITKKNASDIISMKNTDKIFYIVRVFEEKDIYGKVLGVSDEVEVYNGKWGLDSDFNAFTTEKKVDLLTKTVAVNFDRYSKLLSQYNDLFKKYSEEVKRNAELESELIAIRNERDSLQLQLEELLGNTYDGTLLSTDTKYIAFEDNLENISFTEDQYNDAMNELMTKGEVNLENYDLDSPRIEVKVNIKDISQNAKINVYLNGIAQGTAINNQSYYETIYINHDDLFRFECTGVPADLLKTLKLEFAQVSDKYKQSVKIDPSMVDINSDGITVIEGKINFRINSLDENGNEMVDIETGETITEEINAVGNIGTLYCHIGDSPAKDMQDVLDNMRNG